MKNINDIFQLWPRRRKKGVVCMLRGGLNLLTYLFYLFIYKIYTSPSYFILSALNGATNANTFKKDIIKLNTIKFNQKHVIKTFFLKKIYFKTQQLIHRAGRREDLGKCQTLQKSLHM